jgi:hypothetical protein
VGVEIVHDQHDLLGIGVVDIDEFTNKVGPILTGATLGDFDEAFANQRFTGQEQLAHPCCLKGVINSLWLSRLHGQALSFVLEQLFRAFVHAHLRKAWIIRTRVDLQDILHPPDKRCTRFGRDAPVLLQPGLQLVFLRTWRTVSWLTCSV